jgi:hypothetical protein
MHLRNMDGDWSDNLGCVCIVITNEFSEPAHRDDSWQMAQ